MSNFVLKRHSDALTQRERVLYIIYLSLAQNHILQHAGKEEGKLHRERYRTTAVFDSLDELSGQRMDGNKAQLRAESDQP